MLQSNSTFFTLVKQLTGRGVTIFFDDSVLFVPLKAPKGPTDTITGTTTYLYVRFLAMIV